MKTITSAIFCALMFDIAAAQWKSVGRVDSVITRTASTFDAFSGSVLTRVQFVADDAVRIRFAPQGTLGRPLSPAVVHQVSDGIAAERRDDGIRVTLSTAKMVVEIQKLLLRLRFKDAQGNIIDEDDPSKGMCWDGEEVSAYKKLPSDLMLFGLGEKAGALSRKGKFYTMWNSDIPAYSAETDPLYQTIPFFLGIRDGRAFGIFFDNTHRSSFDFGKTTPGRYSFGSTGGGIDYYVFGGPSPKEVMGRYTELVGRMPLPPRWSLGYQQCRWSYYPEQRVREIARTFREKKIPCDVIYLDIDYMEGYRIFTFSEKNFPQPRRMVSDLAAEGFKVAVIVDPGIKVDTSYRAYNTGRNEGVFVKKGDGSIFVGNVWPGACAFPDFTSPAARRWWGNNFKVLVDAGVRGFWNDMNEPSVFNTPDKTVDAAVLHADDGVPEPHAAVHNTYGMLMTQATYEGVRTLRPNERPFVLTRASFAGGHRYSAAWTGDNVATWEHLRMAVTMCLSLSVSGQPFVGTDIGGFIGMPSGELFARWLQLGVFTPLMRAHSVINSPNKEPWAYGKPFENVNRETIGLRYQLLPYIYNVMHESSVSGLPAMRPLAFEYPGDAGAVGNETEFLLGDRLLVAPVLWEGDTVRQMYLPRGTWYDYWTERRCEGGHDTAVTAPLPRIPFFVKAGTILPSQPVVQYSDERPIDPLILTIYPSGTSESTYYEDDGHTFEYLKGVFLQRVFRQRNETGRVEFTASQSDGSYVPPKRNLEIRFVDVGFEPRIVRIDGTEIRPKEDRRDVPFWSFDAARRVLIVRTPDLMTGRIIEAFH